MKQYIKYMLLSLLAVATVPGCVSLDEDLTGQPTSDKFFKTVDDFESFMAGAYTPLVKLYGTDVPYVAGAGAEDVNTTVARWRGIEQVSYNAIGNPDEITSDLWNAYYTSISSCNTMIQICSQSELPAEQIAPFAAEAKFLRAFNYFNLVRWFGEVPLLTEANQTNAAEEEQASVESIYNAIVTDLIAAENGLGTVHSVPSKPCRWTAKALLSKVYLAMAGFPLNKTEYYASARDKANEVIESRTYSMERNFQDLWYWSNRLTNSEFIFALYASVDNGTGSYVNRAVRPWDHGEGGWGDWHSDKRFLGDYPVGTGARYKGTFYLTMIDGTDWSETDYAQPYVAKLRDGGTNSGGYAGPPITNLADGFFCMLRYSDILLVYAEAANKAEGAPSTTAYRHLNDVRTRAGLSELSGLSTTEFDAAVLDERNWELAFECNRWFDLCRRHLLEEKMRVYYPTAQIDDHNYLLPKPTDQLAVMKGVRQNEGYTN